MISGSDKKKTLERRGGGKAMEFKSSGDRRAQPRPRISWFEREKHTVALQWHRNSIADKSEEMNGPPRQERDDMQRT